MKKLYRALLLGLLLVSQGGLFADPDFNSSNWWEVLDVPRDADAKVVRKAYRRLILKHHPDKVKKASETEAATKRFRSIQEAYETFCAPEDAQGEKSREETSSGATVSVKRTTGSGYYFPDESRYVPGKQHGAGTDQYVNYSNVDEWVESIIELMDEEIRLSRQEANASLSFDGKEYTLTPEEVDIIDGLVKRSSGIDFETKVRFSKEGLSLYANNIKRERDYSELLERFFKGAYLRIWGDVEKYLSQRNRLYRAWRKEKRDIDIYKEHLPKLRDYYLEVLDQELPIEKSIKELQNRGSLLNEDESQKLARVLNGVKAVKESQKQQVESAYQAGMHVLNNPPPYEFNRHGVRLNSLYKKQEKEFGDPTFHFGLFDHALEQLRKMADNSDTRIGSSEDAGALYQNPFDIRTGIFPECAPNFKGEYNCYQRSVNSIRTSANQRHAKEVQEKKAREAAERREKEKQDEEKEERRRFVAEARKEAWDKAIREEVKALYWNKHNKYYEDYSENEEKRDELIKFLGDQEGEIYTKISDVRTKLIDENYGVSFPDDDVAREALKTALEEADMTENIFYGLMFNASSAPVDAAGSSPSRLPGSDASSTVIPGVDPEQGAAIGASLTDAQDSPSGLPGAHQDPAQDSDADSSPARLPGSDASSTVTVEQGPARLPGAHQDPAKAFTHSKVAHILAGLGAAGGLGAALHQSSKLSRLEQRQKRLLSENPNADDTPEYRALELLKKRYKRNRNWGAGSAAASIIADAIYHYWINRAAAR